LPSIPNYRLPSAVLDADRDALLALKDLADYTPVNQAYSAPALSTLSEALQQAEEAEVRAQKALAAARDNAAAAAREFHNAMLGAKAQVIAQYGSDSYAVQALGLKKKSERRRPARRSASSQQA
jgi:hypothetical protein